MFDDVRPIAVELSGQAGLTPRAEIASGALGAISQQNRTARASNLYLDRSAPQYIAPEHGSADPRRNLGRSSLPVVVLSKPSWEPSMFARPCFDTRAFIGRL